MSFSHCRVVVHQKGNRFEAKSVQITKYKCIEDSTPWKVDQVTTLIGKNEAGKSAILEALYKLNPVEDDTSDFHPNDYPRRYALTDQGTENSENANVLTTEWSLDEPDLALLRGELPELELLEDTDVRITKGYSNTCSWWIAVDESATVRTLIESCRFDAPERSSVSGNPVTIDALYKVLTVSNLAIITRFSI